MENLNPQENPDFIIFDHSCFKELSVTRKWTKFISVIGFVLLAGMTIVSGFVLSQFFLNVNRGFPVVAVLPSVVLVMLYFFPIYFLSQFSSYSKHALDSLSRESLAKALRYLKLHYVYLGILIIGALVFYLIAFIVVFKSSSGVPFLKF